jgi:hypothetical protein
MTVSGDWTDASPRVGAEVLTLDGDKLGEVKEVSGICFKVDAPMQPDYWLARDCIDGMTGDAVRLNVTRDQLGDMKLDGIDDASETGTHTGIHHHGDTAL